MAKQSSRKSAKEAHHEIGGHCTSLEVPVRQLEAGITPGRLQLIRSNEKKWANHTVLHYCFLDEPARWRGSQADKDAVDRAFQEWKGLPIALEFRRVNNPEEAEIRIGFEAGAGSWSYLGRDAIDLITDPTERTMNFGWALTTDYGYDTALHEIGHALGFPHEHQNPNAGIVWNEDAVYDYFGGPPNNWNRNKTFWNVLRKLPADEYDGSDWDPNSIMHYQFYAGLIEEPGQYRTQPLIPGSGLSPTDEAEAKRLYPVPAAPRFPELRPYEAHRVRLAPGKQLDFIIEPDLSRDYTVQTFGRLDTVLVLFEEIDGEPRFLAGDDDSGFARNAKITQRLFRGRSYYLRLRLYYAHAQGEGALMMY